MDRDRQKTITRQTETNRKKYRENIMEKKETDKIKRTMTNCT